MFDRSDWLLKWNRRESNVVADLTAKNNLANFYPLSFDEFSVGNAPICIAKRTLIEKLGAELKEVPSLRKEDAHESELGLAEEHVYDPLGNRFEYDGGDDKQVISNSKRSNTFEQGLSLEEVESNI
ncbi:hypothetical protein FNV43_RR10497 [Rhamnella rubrinervis]|uniref:Uncharacterized protein n=1 Tax=Rhamnella rubrinervis TaxID=2594499 RepID=A0A8K0H3V6_9ROSA|nr:hypothetical protein FNV43_RR10497 [Rhamnella rubrinervis]